MPKRVNFEKLRQIPILNVSERLGIPIVRIGSDLYAMKDPENPKQVSSLTISVTRNRWKRWSGHEVGGVSEGSVIDLVSHIRECSFADAVEFLSQSFFMKKKTPSRAELKEIDTKVQTMAERNCQLLDQLQILKQEMELWKTSFGYVQSRWNTWNSTNKDIKGGVVTITFTTTAFNELSSALSQ